MSEARGGVAAGYWLVFAAAVLWGLIGLITTGLLSRGISSLEAAFWRALLGGVLFVAHAALKGKLRLHDRRDLLPLGGFALVGVSAFYASLILAIEAGGTSLAFILLYSAPIFVLLGAWLILGEQMTLRKAVLAILAVAGIVLVARGGGSGVVVSAASLSWGLLAGLTYSSYYIFGKFILDRYAPVTIYAWALPIGALGLLPFVSFSAKDAGAWALLAVLAVLSTYLAYFLYYTGLKRIEASRAVLVATIEPVVAVTLAAAFLGERLGFLGVVGAAVILATAVAASLSSRRRRGQEASSEAAP